MTLSPPHSCPQPPFISPPPPSHSCPGSPSYHPCNPFTILSLSPPFISPPTTPLHSCPPPLLYCQPPPSASCPRPPPSLYHSRLPIHPSQQCHSPLPCLTLHRAERDRHSRSRADVRRQDSSEGSTGAAQLFLLLSW